MGVVAGFVVVVVGAREEMQDGQILQIKRSVVAGPYSALAGFDFQTDGFKAVEQGCPARRGAGSMYLKGFFFEV